MITNTSIRFYILLLLTLMLLSQKTVNAQESDSPIRALDLNLISNLLATGHTDRSIRIWDATNYQVFTTVTGPDINPSGLSNERVDINSIDLSPDGNRLAVGFGGGARVGLIWILDTNNGQLLTELQGDEYAGAVSWSPSGDWLATLTASGIGSVGYSTLRIWETTNWTLVNEIELGGSTISVEWNPNRGNQLAVANGMYAIIFDTTLWQVDHALAFEDIVTDLAWRPDGSQIASTGNGTIKIWDSTTGQLISTFQKIDTRDNLEEVAWSPNGNYIASTDVTTIEVWDTTAQQIVFTTDTEIGIEGLVWQSEQTILYGGNFSSTVQIMDLCNFTSTFPTCATPSATPTVIARPTASG